MKLNTIKLIQEKVGKEKERFITKLFLLNILEYDGVKLEQITKWIISKHKFNFYSILDEDDVPLQPYYKGKYELVHIDILIAIAKEIFGEGVANLIENGFESTIFKRVTIKIPKTEVDYKKRDITYYQIVAPATYLNEKKAEINRRLLGIMPLKSIKGNEPYIQQLLQLQYVTENLIFSGKHTNIDELFLSLHNNAEILEKMGLPYEVIAHYQLVTSSQIKQLDNLFCNIQFNNNCCIYLMQELIRIGNYYFVNLDKIEDQNYLNQKLVINGF